MSDFIPLSVPSITGNEWKYVKECLDTAWVSSSGNFVDIFEKKIAEYTGSKYAIACVNGTSALHISLMLAGVAAGDEIIVPTLTFIAPINVIRYCSAFPIFMDADEHYNIHSEKIIEFIKKETIFKNGKTYNRRTKKPIVAMIPVHVFGNAVDFEVLHDICRERNIKIIEDATESLGTKYVRGTSSGKHTGTIGEIGCISFNGNKIITTGGGGMILTDNEEYARKAKYLTTQAKDDEIRYIHDQVGYNYRMTNIQAAIGVAQLEQLPEFIKIKKMNYLNYKEKIDKISGLKIAEPPIFAENNHWMYALQVDKKDYGIDRDILISLLSDRHIQTRPVWFLNHLQKPFATYQNYKIENALRLWKNTLNIPCSSNLSEKDLDKVVEQIRSIKK